MPTYQFTNGDGISVPDDWRTQQTLSVSGLGAPIQSVSIPLTGLTHEWLPDVDFLLVSPDGSVGFEFWSDVSSGLLGTQSATYVLVTDQASEYLPLGNSHLSAGRFRPTDANF